MAERAATQAVESLYERLANEEDARVCTDMAGGNRRTDYVAVSNTVIGIILLIGGSALAALSFSGVCVTRCRARGTRSSRSPGMIAEAMGHAPKPS